MMNMPGWLKRTGEIIFGSAALWCVSAAFVILDDRDYMVRAYSGNPNHVFGLYGSFLFLTGVGLYLLLNRKNPPFSLWVRISGGLAFFTLTGITNLNQWMNWPFIVERPYLELQGHVYGTSIFVMLASLYVLFAGDREGREIRRAVPDHRIKWIRLCGFIIAAWTAAKAAHFGLVRPWREPGMFQTEFNVLMGLSLMLEFGLGAALLVWPHGSASPALRMPSGLRAGRVAPVAATPGGSGLVGRLVMAPWYDWIFYGMLCVLAGFLFFSAGDKRMSWELFTWLDHHIGGARAVAGSEWGSEAGEAGKKVIVDLMGVIMIPGSWALYQVIHLFGYGPGMLDLEWKATVVFAGTAVLLSLFVWNTALCRFAYVLGVYDPFRREFSSWGLPVIEQAREWWIAYTQFGQGVTGRWAGLIEMIAHPWQTGDVFLGRPKLFVGGMLRPVGAETEKHMLTVAGTGAGKSTAGLIPNLCVHEGSLLCIDPKGELAKITARRRGAGGSGVAGMGQDVHILDPYRLVTENGASYNPFDEMAYAVKENPHRAVAFADKIAEAVIKPMGGTSSEYWDKAARTLIRGLVLYIFVHEPPEHRTLVRLRELLMQGDAESYREAVERGYIKKEKTSVFELLLQQMMDVKDGPYGYAIAGAASSILEMGEGQYGSVVTTAQEHTTFLDFPEIRAVCGRSDFYLVDLKRKPMSVYVCLPVAAIGGVQGRWLRMFVVLFTDIVQHSPEKPDPPVLLAIDEFPNLGRLDGIEIIAPLLRSYGVRFWGVAQDLDRLAHVYPDCWSGFVGNAEAVQFMAGAEPKTIEFLSMSLGRHLVGSKQQGQRVSPLLDPEQVRRFLAPEKGYQIIVYGSRVPMKLKLTPYYKYLPYWYYEADSRYEEKWNRRIWRELFG